MLKDKLIVVTGGAGLLGTIFCNAISKAGGIAVVADIRREAAEQVASEIRADGFLAYAAQLDICKKESIDQLIADISAEHGPIYGVVNNAYPKNNNYGRPLEEIEYVDFCEHLNQHLGGYFLVSQRFSKHFQQYKKGAIVNMSSIYGVVAPRFEIYEGTTMTMPLEYASVKSAIIQMTKYFSKYFRNDGIRCNSISPGGIFNNQPEAFVKKYNLNCGKKGMLSSGDIESSLVFLLSEQSKYITGQNLIIDDGFTL